MAQNTKTQIRRITIGRLYNLGNYEHVRYELSVEIGEGRSAALALRNTIRLLKAVNPKPPVPSYDYERAKSQIEKPDDWHKNIEDKTQQAKARKEMVVAAKKTVKKFETWVNRRHAAELVLDDIGGTKAFKDAKLSWSDDDDYGFEA